MLIDTHCHLHDRQFFSETEAEEALKRAKANGIEKIICIGTNLEDSQAAKNFAKSHKEVYWTLGIHPEFASEAQTRHSESPTRHSESPTRHSESPTRHSESPTRHSESPTRHSELVSESPAPIAIGEIGLDYHHSRENREKQIKLFESLLQLAQEKNLPVSFHVREAFDDFFGVVKNFPKIKGVVHSFTDSKKTLKRILAETDFYIGVNGLATYSTLPLPPLEKILLETDAPFLAPIPHRGQKNEPAHIKDIATWLAQKLNLPPETIAETTTQNAKNLFNLKN